MGYRVTGMEKMIDTKDEVIAGGRYARTEEELHAKAIALLDKCKVMTGSSGREKLEAAVRSS
jgi:hypothetical protein